MPTRVPSPDSDSMDRMGSSSPEPPEDPLAGVIIGSQSRAAKRGEYVPVPTRSFRTSTDVASSSTTRGSSNAVSLQPRAGSHLGSRVKPPSKSTPNTEWVAKPPSRLRPPSRPPVSKEKGKAKTFTAIIDVSDNSGDEVIYAPARPTPLHPSRRGNVAETSTATSSTTPASTSTSTFLRAAAANKSTTTRRKRPGTNASKRPITPQFSLVEVESSGDEVEDTAAFVTADEGHGAGSSSRVQAGSGKRRRIDSVAEGGEADVGSPMDIDVDVDRTEVSMSVDAGYQSDSTLSYVSDAPEVDYPVAEQVPQQTQLDTLREESPIPSRESIEEDKRPLPDFKCLRGPSSAITISAQTVSACLNNGTLTNVGVSRTRENAVAGPSNSNSDSNSRSISDPSGTSTSTTIAIASTSKPTANMTSTMITDLKLHPNAGLFDDTGMSPEDAAAAYAAMFGDEDEASAMVPTPTFRPAAPVGLDVAQRSVVTLRDGVVGKGKGKARAEVDPEPEVASVVMAVTGSNMKADVRPQRAPVPAPKWGAWDPLRAAGGTSKHNFLKELGITIETEDNAGFNFLQSALNRARPCGLVTTDEHFLRALRASTAISDSWVEPSDEDATRSADLAYLRHWKRSFEQVSNGDVSHTGKAKEKAREDDKPSAVAAAQNAFTFTFPRGAGVPAEPPVRPQSRQAEEPRQRQDDQPEAVVAPPQDPWAFMFAQPKPHELELAPQEPQHFKPPAPAAPAAPAAQALAFGEAAAPVAPLPVPLPVAAPVPQPGAFTFVFPRAAPGPPALRNVQVQARVPGSVVAPQAQPQVQAQLPRPRPALFPPPAGPAQRPLPAPVQAQPVRAAAPPPPQPAAPVPVPQPAPVVAPAPAPAPVHAPPPAPALSREQLIERATAQITEILPDVEPGYLLAHVATYVEMLKERTAEHVLGLLLEAEAAGGYPRVEGERAPAVPHPVPVQQPQVQPRVQAHQPQPQPVAGGSNLGIRARGGHVQAGADLQRAQEQPNQEPKAEEAVDYEDVNRPRPSEAYRRLSIHYLRLAFSFLPKHIVTTALLQHHNLYAPTFLSLHAAERRYTTFPVRDERPYRCNSTKYNASPERRALAHVWDEAFGEEWVWVEVRQGRGRGLVYTYPGVRASHSAPHDGAAVERVLARHVPGQAPGPVEMQDQPQAAVLPAPAPAEAQAYVVNNEKGKQGAVDIDMNAPGEDQPAEEDGDIECGCCFSEYTFDKMVQCPDAHLFCSECVSQYAATQLGEHNTSIVCMHLSDCKLPFPESELRRVLTPTLMVLFSRLTARKAVAAAGLEGLEECPCCDWQCVIEASIEMDRLFRCGNAEGGCGVVSCRQCKKKDHRPKTCKEMEEDQVLDGQHAIEEAMTRALMRNCPNPMCKKAFVKETGCNKMICSHCRTLSCYVCRQIIKGYDHFDVMPGAAANTAVVGRCKLWENVEERHANEVRAAAERAAEELRRTNPELDHEAIKVDIPVAPPPAPGGAPHRAAPPVVVNRDQAYQQRAAQLRLQQERVQRLVQEEERRQQELRAEILRQERERQAEQRRHMREARELRRQERRQRQQELNRAALAAQLDVDRLAALNPGPFGGPVRALPPVIQAPDQNNRGQRGQ